jgi:peptidoglycan/LPS O-acetylase OafA/YrhL
MFHLTYSHPDFSSLSLFARSLVIAGSHTVQIFFVLSGIFITSSMRHLLETQKRPRLEFAIRRAIRILPLWWILLFWMFATRQISGEVFGANALFFFGTLQLKSKWLPFAQAWSLSVEVCFYVLIAAWARSAVLAKLNTSIVAWVACCFVAAASRFIGSDIFALDEFQLTSNIFSNLSYFAAGLAIEKWHHQGGRLERWLTTRQVIILELLCIGFFVLSSIPPFRVLPLEVIAPSIVILTSSSVGLLAKTMGSWPLRILGLASYGIYILQDAASYYAGRWFGVTSLVQILFFHTVTAIVFGIISCFVIERPLIALGKKLQIGSRI